MLTSYIGKLMEGVIKDKMVHHLLRVTTHLENLEKSGNSKVIREKSGKMEKVREKSGEVKSAEIWLFTQLKYQYHKAVVSYIHAQIILN